MMTDKNMTLREKVCGDIRSLWPDIVHDSGLDFACSGDGNCGCPNLHIDDAGLKCRIKFDVDTFPEKGRTEAMNAIRKIKAYFPNCIRYKISLEDTSVSLKIVLTLELQSESQA